MKNLTQTFLFVVLFCLFLITGMSSASSKTNSGRFYMDTKDQSLDYEVKTNIAPDEFTELFYEKLASEYHWEKACSSSENGAYKSLWQFTDKHDKKWKCKVSISSVVGKGSNIMSVSIRISPLSA